jgi:glycerol-3-phosphate dehydrogenase
MQRDLDALASRHFDLLVIGGGIYGACIARDAALRGLSVALVEKHDFCSGTSHNSLKIIHSGIRYLQHLDFGRVRESIDERRIWLTIAPHLVRPLKFIIPTQGYLTRGPLALQAAILLHRALGADWNRGLPDELKIPTGRVSGRSTLQQCIPGLPLDGLSGAASWHDGQVVDADRVVIECLQSAVEHGAVVANYVEANSLLRSGGKAHGVSATDRAGHGEIEIKARVTVNAAGPWVQKVLDRSLGEDAGSAMPALAKNMNIVTRKLLPRHGVGIPSKRSADAVIGSESRLFFITPWKDVSAIGTTHFPYDGDPDDYRVTEHEISDFIDEINESYPPARLTPEDVLYVYSGLTPAEPEPRKGEVGRSKHAELIDHGSRNGCDGLVSVIGVKYTTSRLVAERVVSLVQRKLGTQGSERQGRERRLPGAQGWKPDRHPDGPRPESSEVRDLLERYGCRPPDGLGDGKESFTKAFEACARHAVDQEMALNLDDFLLRRNDFAARGRLTTSLVRLAAETMGARLNWTAAETEARQTRMCASVRYLTHAGLRASAGRCNIDDNHGIGG